MATLVTERLGERPFPVFEADQQPRAVLGWAALA